MKKLPGAVDIMPLNPSFAISGYSNEDTGLQLGNWEKGNGLGVLITHHPSPITRRIIGVYPPDLV